MSFYIKSLKFAAALLFSSSLVTTTVMADEPTKQASTTTSLSQNQTNSVKIDDNTVLATVNGANITYHDVQDMLKVVSNQYKTIPTPALNSIILEQLIIQKAMLQAAEKENLQNSPNVLFQFDLIKKEILSSVFKQEALDKELKQNPIDDKTLQTFYDQHFVNAPPVKEAHIRHILVKTQAEAIKIINQIHAGKDFALLAKQYSTDKDSGNEHGGDLGWVKQNYPLAPEIINAAFSLKANTITNTPVKTQFGWHVIQVLGYRNASIPPYDKVKEAIRQHLIEQRIKNIIQNLIKQSKITKNNDAIQALTQLSVSKKQK